MREWLLRQQCATFEGTYWWGPAVLGDLPLTQSSSTIKQEEDTLCSGMWRGRVFSSTPFPSTQATAGKSGGVGARRTVDPVLECTAPTLPSWACLCATSLSSPNIPTWLQPGCSEGEEDRDGKEEEELSDRSILRIKWGAIRVCARPI